MGSNMQRQAVPSSPRCGGVCQVGEVCTIRKLVREIARSAKWYVIDILGSDMVVRDANDQYLLALARTCSADYIISGDKDLLDLGAYGRTQVKVLSHRSPAGRRVCVDPRCRIFNRAVYSEQRGVSSDSRGI